MAVITRFRCAGLSDPGRKRENNEDRFHADPDRGIFFVIDGVGGQNAGEKAADTAYTLLRGRLERQTGDVEDRIREAITVANNEIFQLAQTNPEWNGMACVLTVAVVSDGEVTIGQVGDSRLYLMEPGQIRKITHDHSPVGEREDRGELDEISAMNHPRRNEVYRDVGSQEHSPDDPDFIEIARCPFPAGAGLLLCSDGLTDLVPSSDILSLIEENAGDCKAAARALIDAANQAGGKDNITVVLVAGPQFGSSLSAGRPAVARANPAPHRTSTALTGSLFLVIGFLIAAALIFALKPHWRETQDGIIFGFGAIREPRTLRVTTDVNTALAGAQPGDTVLVPAGVYREQIQLKDGVRLIAERPRESVLASSGIAVQGSGLRSGRLEGFRIVPSEQAPLQVGLQLRNSSLEILDNEITGASEAAVEVSGKSSGTLRANHIYANPGAGILISEESSPRLVHNVVNGNGRTGIEVRSGANPVFIGNTVTRNGQDLETPAAFNRDLVIRQNFIGTAEQPKRNPRAKAVAK